MADEKNSPSSSKKSEDSTEESDSTPRKIQVTVKTPKEKIVIEVDENATVEEVSKVRIEHNLYYQFNLAISNVKFLY